MHTTRRDDAQGFHERQDGTWGRNTPSCNLAPPGWHCSREPGHSGPCAAEPVTQAEPVAWLICQHGSHDAVTLSRDFAERRKASGAEITPLWVQVPPDAQVNPQPSTGGLPKEQVQK